MFGANWEVTIMPENPQWCVLFLKCITWVHPRCSIEAFNWFQYTCGPVANGNRNVAVTQTVVEPGLWIQLSVSTFGIYVSVTVLWNKEHNYEDNFATEGFMSDYRTEQSYGKLLLMIVSF